MSRALHEHGVRIILPSVKLDRRFSRIQWSKRQPYFYCIADTLQDECAEWAHGETYSHLSELVQGTIRVWTAKQCWYLKECFDETHQAIESPYRG